MRLFQSYLLYAYMCTFVKPNPVSFMGDLNRQADGAALVDKIELSDFARSSVLMKHLTRQFARYD